MSFAKSSSLSKSWKSTYLNMLARTDLDPDKYVPPLSSTAFRTPFANSSRWVEVKKINPADPASPSPFSDTALYDGFSRKYDPYPAWVDPVPVLRDDIEAIFIKLLRVFGFQFDSTRNMYDYLMKLLDLRASRMSPATALRTVHADYIGGPNANFRKWYFAAGIDVDDASSEGAKTSPEESEMIWASTMREYSPEQCVTQVALYLLIWGEANNVRFMPECLCFVFKCCNDYYTAVGDLAPAPEPFLSHIITPLYEYYRDQSYVLVDGKYIHNDRDHHRIVGYDDMNQLFWYRKGLDRLVTADKTRIMALPQKDRYLRLGAVAWARVFYKTFREKRTWAHLFINFSRVWIIHFLVFWYYTSLNAPSLYTRNYRIDTNHPPTAQTTLAVMSLAGAVACGFALLGVVLELFFVPRKFPGAQPVLWRTSCLTALLLINLVPQIWLLSSRPLDASSTAGFFLLLGLFLLSLATVMYLLLTPSSHLFGAYNPTRFSHHHFSAAIHHLQGTDKMASYGLWAAVFASKLLLLYFFLSVSLRDSIRELSVMQLPNCAGEAWFGSALCRHHPVLLLVLMLVTDAELFLLDSYLWYILWTTVFSICRLFYIGVSIWTPWRNIFSRLPKRIFSKIIFAPRDKNVKSKFLVLQVWNLVIIAMYREHLLCLEHVQKLIYKQIVDADGSLVLKEPTFFVSQEDSSMKLTLFYETSDAQRRITFFAQSLATPMPDTTSTHLMPCFTVLIPHYNEKITLSLREIIREEDQYSHVTMLEYLKQLHPLEWTNFVRDTKMLAEEYDSDDSLTDYKKDKVDDLPYYSIGFKIASPEYILRTRIWASLRSQTLYRTVSGFMNYSRAIKLLYDVENDTDDDEYDKLEAASYTALRKFRIITSMQRLMHFTPEEKENKEFLLQAYPEVQIAYLEEDIDVETGDTTYYLCLIDGTCAILENGDRQPKYRIRLLGNPILGDGKSDNQNHLLIFTRGEYIQLVDANQDNYLEECLKIRSVLAEFEEMSLPSDPYSDQVNRHPVAIIGTREYIFSENIGILGDIAAGKEQTFGTLFARTLAHIGGKLHYGHPDFLNSIFMTTRGGVLKAQKGLHLNEDIYAGINALLRGGRIKHCEYMQCGKGRDLGFGSILNFTTKIGAGMSEQILSREYFYLGSNLPLDRFLSFFYAHPGFHLNNVLIILSFKLFLLVSVNLAALTADSHVCEFNRHRPISDPRFPVGCHNLIPAVHWLERCIHSIIVVFVILFIPLWVQELTERGIYKAITRLGKHFALFSPLFEGFVCRIYAYSLVSDISIGGARYIATGRGFATVRVSLATLYSRFGHETAKFAAVCGFLILYCSITMWRVQFLYFWLSIVGLLICPYLFNPNQFSWTEFFLDYKDYTQWLFRGNSVSRTLSWMGYSKLIRSRFTGVGRRSARDLDEEIRLVNDIRPLALGIFFSEIIFKIMQAGVVLVAYLFANSQNDTHLALPANSLARILVVLFGPVAVNLAVLIFFFFVSVVTGPFMSLVIKKYPSFIAATVHLLAVVNHIFFFELLWFLQNWDLARTTLGFVVLCLLQSLVFQLIMVFCILKENRHGRSNRAWWLGKWAFSGLGWQMFTQPFREVLCKVIELSSFVADMLIGHVILFLQIPFLLVPYANVWHTMMLFWLNPNNQMRPRLVSKKKRRRRRITVNVFALVFVGALVAFASIFVLPMLVVHVAKVDLRKYAPEVLEQLIQPEHTSVAPRGIHGDLFRPTK